MMWGRANRDKGLAQRFAAAVNAHDLIALSDLMHDDFTYIDSWREGIVGRQVALDAIKLLFDRDPDFAIEVEETSFKQPEVLMRGLVRSPYFGGDRRAVWRIVCEGDQVREWQSWAEGGPPGMTRNLAPDDLRDMSNLAGDSPDSD